MGRDAGTGCGRLIMTKKDISAKPCGYINLGDTEVSLFL